MQNGTTPLLNYVSGELSKEAAKKFKAEVMSMLDCSKTKYYRILHDSEILNEVEKNAIAELAGKPLCELFPNQENLIENHEQQD